MKQAALLARTEIACQTGSWEWDADTGVSIWSDNCFRLLGYEPGEIEPTRDSFQERVHPEDLIRLGRTLEGFSERDGPGAVRYRIVTPGGDVRYMRATVVTVENEEGRAGRVLGSIQDVTDLRNDREIEARYAVSFALDEWETFDDSIENLLAKLTTFLDCCVGFVWLPEGDLLSMRRCWNHESVDAEELASASAGLRLPRGADLPGRAWERGEPVTGRGPLNPDRLRTARTAGLCEGAAFPVMKADELLAVIELYAREREIFDERLLHALVGIGHELGHFLATRRSELSPPELTPREIEILRLASDGESGPTISAKLQISPSTVKTHFENIYEKLGVHDRGEAVAYGLRKGMIQ